MGAAAEMRMLMVGLSCLALLPFGYAMGVAREAVPERAWGYRRFHANDSLIGQRVPCTHQEKLCFAHNLLYDSVNKSCTELSFKQYADQQEFLHGSGHLRITESVDYFPIFRMERMAYDGAYYKDDIVRNVLCGCNAFPTPHIFGGAECRCVPADPRHFEQPPEDGSCVVPDIRFPDIRREHFFRSSYDAIQGFKSNELQPAALRVPLLRLSCSPQQRECFSRGQVWLQGACVPLLQRGPCSQEHVVALDAAAAGNGHVNTTCVHVRGGCPPGHVRAAFDGSCHSEDDLRIVVPGQMHSNQFGVYIAVHQNMYKLEFGLFTENDKTSGKEDVCVIQPQGSFYPGTLGIPATRPECGVDDGGKCSKYDIRTQPPQPEV